MSTVPGNPALPAPLAPAMHPGDRDTHLDLDDLIDHSHEATQQASAGAQHPTRRWKRGVGRKSKTRKPRNPDAVMPLADHLVEFRKRFVRAIAGIIIMSIVGWMFSDQVFRILQQPFLTAAGQQQGLMSIIQWRGLRIQRKAGDCVLPWSDGLLPVVVIPSVGIH